MTAVTNGRQESALYVNSSLVGDQGKGQFSDKKAPNDHYLALCVYASADVSYRGGGDVGGCCVRMPDSSLV
jgi:hypothetical protein